MIYPDLARGVILHLCWRHEIVFDLDEPLRDSTLMRTSSLGLRAERAVLMHGSFRLQSGAWVWFDGLQYEVSALVGTTNVRLISALALNDRQIVTIPVASLLADPTFRLCTGDEDHHARHYHSGGDGGTDEEHRLLIDSVAMVDGLAHVDPAEVERLADLQAHMLELTTGYRSGNPEVAVEGEPRDGYDPAPDRGQTISAVPEMEVGTEPSAGRMATSMGAGLPARTRHALTPTPAQSGRCGQRLQPSSESHYRHLIGESARQEGRGL